MNITRILTCFKSFSRVLAKDRVDAKGDAGADPENPERDGRDTCQLYSRNQYRAETNCGIARILGILLMNSCDT